MRDYELVVILNPEVAEEDVPSAIEKVSQFITQKGGAVADVNHWGRRRLAYPIEHFMEGNYVITQFKLEPNLTSELEAELRLSDQILRHLLIRAGD